MEQNNINIADLLKDCPKGTKLYSTVCGECELDETTEDEIHTIYSNGGRMDYFTDGKLRRDGECLLFPSKEVRNWGCFNVRQMVKISSLEGIEDISNFLKEKKEALLIRSIDAWSEAEVGDVMYKDRLDGFWKCAKAGTPECDYIIATGMRADMEETPKFQVGDVVCDKASGCIYMLTEDTSKHSIAFTRDIKDLEEDFTLATPEEIAKWNEETLQPFHLHYSKSKRKIIDWFLPFDRVVAMREDKEAWYCDIFSHYTEGDYYPFKTVGYMSYKHCLPYNEKTAKLIGTKDEYKEE